MAILNPLLDKLRHSNITQGELKTAEILQNKLFEDTRVWYEPLIPPKNDKPDFLIYDPGRGILVVEVKDWKIESIQSADSKYVTLQDGTVTINPYEQVRNYAYAIENQCKTCKVLVNPPGHKYEGRLNFPYGLVVIFTNITRTELKNNNLESVFGNGSVFCQDEFFQSIDDHLFREKLWSVLPFSIETRLSPQHLNSFTQVLGIPYIRSGSNQPKPTTKTTEKPNKDTEDILPIDTDTFFDDSGKNSPEGKGLTRIIIAAISLISFLGFSIYFFSNPKLSAITNKKQDSSSLSNNSEQVLETNSIIIGVLGSPDYYLGLVDYLRDRFGSNIKIIVDGDGETPYQEAKNQIIYKNWDLVFSLSPMISVAAKDNNYQWLGRMFIDYPPYYQSALFVRADSPIQSIKDINANTSIALGDFNSASSFNMPTYDLYGKTLTVSIGHRGQNIRQMVKTGEVDIGAAAYGDVITQDPDFRIIHLSRNIPGSGVYLSPNLSNSDRQKIRKVLLNAPEEIKKAANYGEAEEIDYSNFRGIVSRVEKIMSCSDWNKNPVQFYCSEDNAIVARVNGITKFDSNTIKLKAKTQNSQNYTVLVPIQTLEKVSNAENIVNLQNKEIKLVNVVPQKLSNGRLQIEIKQPEQISVLN